MISLKDIERLENLVDRLIERKNIASEGLLAIASFDLEEETGYNDNLAKTVAYSRLKEIAIDTLDKMSKV